VWELGQDVSQLLLARNMANNNLIVIAYLSHKLMIDRDAPSAMVMAPVLGKEYAG
jgi:TPP-dependent pyruvate/acetoin dehydrogenase alpha subunit